MKKAVVKYYSVEVTEYPGEHFCVAAVSEKAAKKETRKRGLKILVIEETTIRKAKTCYSYHGFAADGCQFKKGEKTYWFGAMGTKDMEPGPCCM